MGESRAVETAPQYKESLRDLVVVRKGFIPLGDTMAVDVRAVETAPQFNESLRDLVVVRKGFYPAAGGRYG